MTTKKSSNADAPKALEPEAEAEAPPTAAPPPPSPAQPDPPVKTIADEQRERSEEIQRIGVEAFKAKFDTRDPEAKQQPVAGVGKANLEAFRS
jgi:hypothetical protein